MTLFTRVLTRLNLSARWFSWNIYIILKSVCGYDGDVAFFNFFVTYRGGETDDNKKINVIIIKQKREKL